MNNIIYPNVLLGDNVVIEDYVILGHPPKGRKPGELKLIIGDNAIIRSHSVIYSGNTIGHNFQTGHHVTIREDNKIGDNVSVGTGTCIEHHTIIENDVRLHSQVFLPEFSILRKASWIGPNVVFTNAKYPKSNDVKENLFGAIVGENAKIGANVTILPDVKIGKYALIGAGSVVTHDVLDDSVVVGNPAHKINKLSNIDNYNQGRI